MLDAESIDASEELRDELEANAAGPVVDPRTVPTRFSLLKKMALSPAHYFHAAQQPQDETIASKLGSITTDRTGALRFGTAVHLFLLGDPNKVSRFSGRRAGKIWEKHQETAAEEGATTILNDREFGLATRVADAIRRNKRAMELLHDGTVREERIDWTFIGKSARSTPDARGGSRSGGRRHVTDLKTAVSSEPSAFARVALRLFYDAQLWLYGEAMEEAGEKRPDDAYIVAVEKTAPWPVSILRVTDRALDRGAQLCRGWIERLNVCEATNQWPEYLLEDGELDLWEPGEDLGLEFNGKKVTL